MISRIFVFFLLLIFSHSALASVWFEPSDIRLKLDIELLSDRGVLPVTAGSWPIYAPDLDRALTSVSNLDSLNKVEKAAYYRLKSRVSRVRSKQLDLKPEKLLRISTVSEPLLFSGFESRNVYGQGSSASAVTRQVYKSVAFQVSLSRAEGDNRLDGSYIATTLADTVVTVGSQNRWWGPGQDSSLLWSTQSRPVFGVHFQRVSSEPSSIPLLNALGPLNYQAFIGSLQDSSTPNPNPDDKSINFYSARIEARPFKRLQIGVSGLTFDEVNVIADEPVKQSLMGVDFRYGFSLLDKSFSLYGQAAKEVDSVADQGWNTLLGIGSYADFPSLRGQLHWYLEALDATEEIFEQGVDRSDSSADFRHNDQSFASNIGYGGRSLTLGGIWTAQSGWAVKSSVKYAEWQASDHSGTVMSLFPESVQGEDVEFLGMTLTGEFYWDKHFKIEPTLFYQKFNHQSEFMDNNAGLGLSLSYLY